MSARQKIISFVLCTSILCIHGMPFSKKAKASSGKSESSVVASGTEPLRDKPIATSLSDPQPGVDPDAAGVIEEYSGTVYLSKQGKVVAAGASLGNNKASDEASGDAAARSMKTTSMHRAAKPAFAEERSVGSGEEESYSAKGNIPEEQGEAENEQGGEDIESPTKDGQNDALEERHASKGNKLAGETDVDDAPSFGVQRRDSVREPSDRLLMVQAPALDLEEKAGQKPESRNVIEQIPIAGASNQDGDEKRQTNE